MYIHICSTPCATLSFLSPKDFKIPPQTLLQGTSLRLDPQHRTEDSQWPCQPQEGDEGGEIWQLALLFFPFDHPPCPATDLRGMSHLCQGKPLTQYICHGRDPALYLVLMTIMENWCSQSRPFTSSREFKSQVSAVGSRSWLHKWHCHTVQKLFVPVVMSFYLT